MSYANVNGINLYYETHGAGRPLVLLHGGLGSGELFVPALSQLAEHHQVVVPDLQGHGRTADIDRPIDVRLMANDIAALIHHVRACQFEMVDQCGYVVGHQPDVDGSIDVSGTAMALQVDGDDLVPLGELWKNRPEHLAR